MLFAFHDEFSKQFAYLVLGGLQGFPAEWRGAVHLPQGLAISLCGGSQVSFLLQPMKKRIEASWTDPVPMPGKLFDHAQSEDWLFGGVVQNMQAYQARVQITIRSKRAMIETRFRHQIE